MPGTSIIQTLRRVGLLAFPTVGVCLFLLLSCSGDEILMAPSDERAAEKTPFQREDHGYAAIHIQQDKPVESKDFWVDGATMYMTYEDGTIQVPGNMDIKLRGNATLYLPKRSYNIRLQEDFPVIGFPSGRHWCLLANWRDHTIIRNDLAFEISRRAGMAWTPWGDFVDLYWNEEYRGVYYLCEKIRAGESRVDIRKQGFLLEQDIYYDEEHCFRTDLLDIPFMVKEPDGDDFIPEAFEELRTFVNQVERLLVAGDPAWKESVDMDSFIRYWLVFELTQNWEPNNPKSCFMYRNPDGPLIAGPVWDFDWHTFIPEPEGFVIKDALWYHYLFKDTEFKNTAKAVWEETRQDFAAFPAYIDALVERIRPHALVNAEMWPIPGYINGDEDLPWDDSVSRIRSCFIERFTWLDRAIRAL